MNARRFLFRILVYSIILTVFLTNCSGLMIKKWEPPRNVETVRVLLDKTSGKIILKTKGIFTVYDVNQLVIKKGIDSIIIDPGSLKARIRLTADNNFFTYKGKNYRGEFYLIPEQNGKVDVIDVVKLEEYLYSVVPSEMPASWPLEALKAQAVCARTYAVKEMLNHKTKSFDLNADTSSQMYTGMQKEQTKSVQAVKDTSGILAVYDGEPIQSFFHSNSGGITEKPENLWGNKVPYLTSVKSPYCKVGQNYSWKTTISQSTINDKLQKYGVGNVEKIIVLGRTSSDRVDLLEIHGSNKTIKFKGKDFRDLFGGTIIKSLRFGIKKDLNGFYVKGLGFGHGIGLSQWGSYSMAKEDHSFKDILKYYFKGISLAKIDR